MTLGTQGCPVGEAPKHHNDDDDDGLGDEDVEEDDDDDYDTGDCGDDNELPLEAL